MELDLEMHRLNGTVIHTQISFPDEASALVLKAQATTVRSKATDIVDLWRCLEIGLAAGLRPEDFDFADGRAAIVIVRRLFDDRTGTGMSALVDEQRLSERAAIQRFTRIQALLDRVTGPTGLG